jgi:hypothetical protein
MGIRQVAAQRAIGKGPSLVIPKGTPVLPAVAPQGDPARNDHKSNVGGRTGRALRVPKG